MAWYKVTLSPENFPMEGQAIYRALKERWLLANYPKRVTLLVDHYAKEDGRSLYFSAEAGAIFSDELVKRSAEPCDEPDRLSVSKVLG